MRIDSAIVGPAFAALGYILSQISCVHASPPSSPNRILDASIARELTPRYVSQQSHPIDAVDDRLSHSQISPDHQGRADDEITIIPISVGVSLTQATCSDSADPISCATIATVAVYSNFFAAPWSGGRRSSDALYANTEYPPVPGCSTACRLKSEAEEGDWRAIGNVRLHYKLGALLRAYDRSVQVTVDGAFHNIFYRRQETVSGLRAVRSCTPSAGNGKRQQDVEDNDGGMVADYYYVDEDEPAIDTFNSTISQIQTYAQETTSAFAAAGTILGCAIFSDSDSALDEGLLAFGWNAQPFVFSSPSEANSLAQECYDETFPGRVSHSKHWC